MVGAGTRASVIQDHALFRFGDGQSLSVISGAPVSEELALHFGNEDIWDGNWGFHVAPGVVGYIRPDFVGQLRAGTTTGPTLLPLTSAGLAASPVIRAALHFSAGDSLVDDNFGLGQHTNLGVQLFGFGRRGLAERIGWFMWGDPAGDEAWASGRWTASSRAGWQMGPGWVKRQCRSCLAASGAGASGLRQHAVFEWSGHRGRTPTAAIQAMNLISGVIYPTQRIKNLKVGGALTAGGSSFTGDMDELQFFTLAPGAVFSPEAELAPSAQPELRVQSSPQPVSAVMVGRSTTFYAEITNVGSGMATITPQSFAGDGAVDYRLAGSASGIWQDDPSGSMTRTLAPGERSLLEVTFTPRALGPRPATLRLLSNDPQRPEIEISFPGVGVEAQPRLIVGQSRTQRQIGAHSAGCCWGKPPAPTSIWAMLAG